MTLVFKAYMVPLADVELITGTDRMLLSQETPLEAETVGLSFEAGRHGAVRERRCGQLIVAERGARERVGFALRDDKS